MRNRAYNGGDFRFSPIQLLSNRDEHLVRLELSGFGEMTYLDDLRILLQEEIDCPLKMAKVIEEERAKIQGIIEIEFWEIKAIFGDFSFHEIAKKVHQVFQ